MIKFGVAGNSNSFYAEGNKHTIEAAKWLKSKGLDILEFSFGQGIRMSADTSRKIGEEFIQEGIDLSIHAPYFINFANEDPKKIKNSIAYVTDSLAYLNYFGTGERLVVHPASQGKQTREIAVETCKSNLYKLAEIVNTKYPNYKICLETMGKISQIGTVSEIADFCQIYENFYPCIDFGHINAREQGILKKPDDYKRIIDFLFDKLPPEKVLNMHIHFSKIMYGKSGEIRHLTFEDTVYGPNFEDLAVILHEYKMTPIIICESAGTQAEDSMTMKQIYLSLTKF